VIMGQPLGKCAHECGKKKGLYELPRHYEASLKRRGSEVRRRFYSLGPVYKWALIYDGLDF